MGGVRGCAGHRRGKGGSQPAKERDVPPGRGDPGRRRCGRRRGASACGAFVPVRRRGHRYLRLHRAAALHRATAWRGMTSQGVVGAPEAAGHLRIATRLVWSAAPLTASVYCVLSLLAAAGPVTAAALIRSLLDRLALGAAVALGVLGLVAALAGPVRGYLRE